MLKGVLRVIQQHIGPFMDFVPFWTLALDGILNQYLELWCLEGVTLGGVGGNQDSLVFFIVRIFTYHVTYISNAHRSI